MKYLTLILIGLLFPFMLFGQSENKDGTKYYGRYTYPSVDKPKIVFDLCPEGYFNFYKDKDAKSHQDIIHVEWKTEDGYYKIEDSMIHVIMIKKHSRYQFRIIDSLNLEVVFSSEPVLKKGKIIYRISGFFDNIDFACGYFESDYYYRWFIQDNSSDSEDNFECLYKEKFDEELIYFHYDEKTILPDNIYKKQPENNHKKKK